MQASWSQRPYAYLPCHAVSPHIMSDMFPSTSFLFFCQIDWNIIIILIFIIFFTDSCWYMRILIFFSIIYLSWIMVNFCKYSICTWRRCIFLTCWVQNLVYEIKVVICTDISSHVFLHNVLSAWSTREVLRFLTVILDLSISLYNTPHVSYMCVCFYVCVSVPMFLDTYRFIVVTF